MNDLDKEILLGLSQVPVMDKEKDRGADNLRDRRGRDKVLAPVEVDPVLDSDRGQASCLARQVPGVGGLEVFNCFSKNSSIA